MSFLKKRKGLIIFLTILVFLLAVLSLARSLVLKEVGERLDQAFEVGELKLSYVPPGLTVSNLKTRSDNPKFSIDSLKISISLISLVRKDKPVRIEATRPVLFYKAEANQDEKESGGQPGFSVDFPLVIESGYLNDGHFSFEIDEGSYELSGVSAFFRLNENGLYLMLRSTRSKIRPYDSPEMLEGELEALVTTKGQTVNINRLIVQGANSAIRLEGEIAREEAIRVDLRAVYNLDTSFIMSALDLPFNWQGKASGEVTITNESGPVVVKANYQIKDFWLNGVEMGLAEGQARVEPGKGGQILTEIKKNQQPVERVIINYGSGKIEGQMFGFYLDPIMTYASVPWPVASPAWGKFLLHGDQLQAFAEFRDDVEAKPAGEKYAFNGLVNIDLNLPKKDLKIQANDLKTSFGRLDIDGQIGIGNFLDLGIRGQFADIKAAREFTQDILNDTFDFPEIRGGGRSEIVVSGDYYNPDLNFEFSLSPAGFERFDLAMARGQVAVKGGEVEGKVYVVDKNFLGEIEVKTEKGEIETKIFMERALIETVLSYLEVDFPIRGPARGEFIYISGPERDDIEGDFFSDELFLLGISIKEVEGRIVWGDDTLSFPKLRFKLNEGEVSGRLSLGFEPDSYDFDLKVSQVELQPFLDDFSGQISLELKDQGIFGQDNFGGSFSVERLRVYFLQAQASSGEYNLNFINNSLSVEITGNLLPEGGKYEVKLEIPFDRDFLSGEVKGQLTNLDLLLPRQGARGSVDYLLSFQGPVSSLDLTGAVELKGSLIPIPGFAHALTDFSGLAFIKNNQVSIKSFQGLLGGGQVQGFGELNFGQAGLEKAQIQMDGQNMQLSVIERTRALADGQLKFFKEGERSVLEGDFLLREFLWNRELWDELSFSSSAYLEEDQRSWTDDLNLNLRLRANDNVWMENSLGRLRARLDLTISGTLSSPVITGEIETLSGTVYFQDQDFRILRGRVSFFNPLVIDPYLDFQVETYVKDYHVLFSLTGPISRLQPEFSSSPPLPPEEILSLLALGESYQRRYSLDTTQMSTASLISYQLSRAPESFFSLDRFRLDPFVMGSTSEITARLTVGKRLSRNFSIVYSTNLATQREEIIRLEWELSRGLSLVAIRNELGRLSFDLKLRRRF